MIEPLPGIPSEIQSQVQAADWRLKEWLMDHYPRGMILKWKNGRHVGRLCRVITAVAITEPDGQMTVGVRVDTMRRDGRGFMSRSDQFHRIYHDPTYFFEREKNETNSDT